MAETVEEGREEEGRESEKEEEEQGIAAEHLRCLDSTEIATKIIEGPLMDEFDAVVWFTQAQNNVGPFAK